MHQSRLCVRNYPTLTHASDILVQVKQHSPNSNISMKDLTICQDLLVGSSMQDQIVRLNVIMP
jgi:hypothetical protein